MKTGRQRLHALWTIVVKPILIIAAGIVMVNVPTFIFRNVAQGILLYLGIQSGSIYTFVIFCVRMVAVILFYVLYVHVFEHRKVSELAVDRSVLRVLGLGVFLGFSAITIVLVILWMLGSFRILGVNSTAPLFENIFYHAFFALLQDIVFFAILFRVLESRIGSIPAVGIISFAFGFVHLSYPGYTLWSAVAQSFEAGVLFAACFILTRNIWMIWGFHAMWNTIQYGFLLGFAPDESVPYFDTQFTGPSLLTGMPVGLEASILTFLIGTTLGIYLLYKAYRTGNFIAPTIHFQRKQ